MPNGTPSLRQATPWRVLDGFGRVLKSAGRWSAPENVDALGQLLAQARAEKLPVTFRGAGRSYGDASLNQGGLAVDLRHLNRMLDWNPREGIADVEPGMTIEGLWRRTIEDGWWPAVVPGTMFPTIGGCVAMNIHGKNNFAAGPFGEHVLDIDLLTTDGGVRRISPLVEPDLFHAVIGGVGLLGVITRARLQLKRVQSGRLRVEPIVTESIDDMVDRFEERVPRSDYLVGWVDCMARGDDLGRGLIHQANYLHADEDDDRDSLHIERQVIGSTIFGLPRKHLWRLMRPWANDLGWRFVNAVKFHSSKLPGATKPYLQSHVAFAFLLDYIPNWRLAYGPAGFAQYQLFVPKETVRTAVPELLRLCQSRGFPPYLGVFKRHRRDDFLLSHAVDGYSLALDFPARDWAGLQAVAHEMTKLVLDAGGRFYLAKDSLLSAEELQQAYGDRIGRFLSWREQLDPTRMLTSELAKRLCAGLAATHCQVLKVSRRPARTENARTASETVVFRSLDLSLSRRSFVDPNRLTDDGDGVDLDQRAARQLGHLDGGARGRIGRKVAAVHLVDGGKVVEVLQVDRRLDHLRERASGGRQDRFQVLHDPRGLRAHVADTDERTAGVERNLPRAEHEAAGGDRLAVGADGLRRVGGLDDLAHGHLFLSAPPKAAANGLLNGVFAFIVGGAFCLCFAV